MAEALVVFAAEEILKKVLSIAANELNITLGYEEKLTSLGKTLKLIRARLVDAEGKKGRHDVMEWLNQLKDVVGEADDVMDEVHYEMLRRQVKKRDQKAKILPSLPSLKKLSFRREMGHKIENINKMLLEINKQANGLGLQNEHLDDSVPGRLVWKETVPHPEKYKIVGRDDEKLRIIELLSQSTNEKKLTMVDINTLLAKIYESLTQKKPTSDLKVNLIKSIEEELASKRYLIVLDDVWVEERPYWEDFRSCMLDINSQNGSAILVTTRKLQIGTHDMMMNSCSLKSLSNDECWSIFEERLLVEGESPSAELVEIGRAIAKKCGGLPLLLNVIGGMLANDRNKDKWLSIRNSPVWELEDEKERVEQSLKLSFDNLPNSMVKQCFAYCSIYKKDAVMKKEELVQLWMALGLIQADEQKQKDMEDVGNDIFQILVSNSLFQNVKVDMHSNAIGYSMHENGVTMHDLVHDVLLSLSKQESLCLVDATNDDVACTKRNNNPEFRIKVSLHTIFSGHVNFSSQRFKCMRILSLKKCNIEKIDDSIGELVHLRYLYLSSTRISVLPESIGKLYHLQTLKLKDCYNLKKFPISIRNLISLRCWKSEESIPANIAGKLTSLRTLDKFQVGGEKGNQIEELGRLKHLGGKLHILSLENVSSKEDAVKAGLSAKKNLNDITFSWGGYGDKKYTDVLEGLQPPANLKVLSIIAFNGDEFPEWVMKMAINMQGKWTPLDKLTKITLVGCRMCPSLPRLEHLPHLQYLNLSSMPELTCLRSSVGECHNVIRSTKPLFPSLRWLELGFMDRLEKWIDAEDNSLKMISPVLETLKIDHCPMIMLLDECHPHPLVTLHIEDCKNLVSINSIQGLTSLRFLRIARCPSLSGITNLPKQCHSLENLDITYCNKLTSLPREIFISFAFLSKLTLGPFSEELDSFPSLQGIQNLRNRLQSLELRGVNQWESLPEEIQHLTSLTYLTIEGFGIQELPVWLTNMSSIRKIELYECEGLNARTVALGAPLKADFVFLDFNRITLL